MGGKASRSKGSRGESEARKAWAAEGFKVAPWRGGVEGPDYLAERDGLLFSVEMTLDKTRLTKPYYNLDKAEKGPGIAISRVRGTRQRAVIQLYEDDLFKLLRRES